MSYVPQFDCHVVAGNNMVPICEEVSSRDVVKPLFEIFFRVVHTTISVGLWAEGCVLMRSGCTKFNTWLRVKIWSFSKVTHVDVSKTCCVKEDTALWSLVETCFRDYLIFLSWWTTARRLISRVFFANSCTTASKEDKVWLWDRSVQVPKCDCIFIGRKEVLSIRRQW